MDLIEFRQFCLSFDGVNEKMPFGKFAKRYESILAFYVCGHMFCFIDIDNFAFVNVKCDPQQIENLYQHYSSIEKPINRSLRYWIQINFDGDIPDKKIIELVKQSYNLVLSKYTLQKRP